MIRPFFYEYIWMSRINGISLQDKTIQTVTGFVNAIRLKEA